MRTLLHRLLMTSAAMAVVACGSSDSPEQPQSPALDPPGESDEPPTDGAALASHAGVSSEKGQFVVDLAWLTPPASEAYLRARLTFADAQRQYPKSVEDVAFEPWMPSMGHGTDMQDQTITPGPSANIFEVKDAFLIMGGEWEVKISATVDGVRDVALVAVRVR